jgi:hypothetical protein
MFDPYRQGDEREAVAPRPPRYLRVAQALALAGEVAFGGPCPSPLCVCPVPDGGDTDGAYLDGRLYPDGRTTSFWERFPHGGTCTSVEVNAGCYSETFPSGPRPPPDLPA